MADRWGTPKEYAAYFRMLLTQSGRKEFHWWLEKHNPDLYQRFLKELAHGRKADGKKGEQQSQVVEGQGNDGDAQEIS